MKFGTVILCHVINKMAKFFFQTSNCSCDDDVTNFVKFIQTTAKIRDFH